MTISGGSLKRIYAYILYETDGCGNDGHTQKQIRAECEKNTEKNMYFARWIR
jgi:hypothetical protein